MSAKVKMNADEIRIEAQRIDDDPTWGASFLAEIAAQLAELNQTLRRRDSDLLDACQELSEFAERQGWQHVAINKAKAAIAKAKAGQA